MDVYPYMIRRRVVSIGSKSVPLLLLALTAATMASAIVATFYLLKAGYVTITVTKPAPGAYTITGTVQVGEVGAGGKFDGGGHGRLSVVDTAVAIGNDNISVFADNLQPEELQALWDTRVRISIENDTVEYYGYLTVVKDGQFVNEFDGWYARNKTTWWSYYVGPIVLSPGQYDVYMDVDGTAGYPTETTTVDFFVMVNATTVNATTIATS